MCDGTVGWIDSCLNICNQRVLSQDIDKLEQMKRHTNKDGDGSSMTRQQGESGIYLGCEVGRLRADTSLKFKDQGMEEESDMHCMCISNDYK